MIKISENIPVPTSAISRKRRKKTSERQDAIGKLEFGHSFFLKTTLNSVSTLIWWANARYPERTFACIKVDGGVRIWRTK